MMFDEMNDSERLNVGTMIRMVNVEVYGIQYNPNSIILRFSQ